MKKILIALLVVTSFLQISCSSDTVNNSPTTNSVDVYVAGSKNNQACYWKNNQLVMLNSNNLPSTYATKIIVSNEDVYVLGRGGDAITAYSLFWKNGILTNLNTEFNAILLDINDFDVVGNDIYIVGSTNNIQTNGYNFGYWKNGDRTILNSNTPDYNPSYIKVLNNNVYTAINFPTQGYYINSTYYETPDKINNGLVCVGDEMYIYGSFQQSGFYYNITNNTNTNIGFPDDNSITKMCFDNSNVYYCDINEIYKNSTLFIPRPVEYSGIIDFKVLNNNVYVLRGFGANPANALEINNITIIQSAIDETFNSLYIVQN